MAKPSAARSYEKHAWLVFFALGLVGLGAGTYVALNPIPAESEFQAIAGVSWSAFSSSNPGPSTFQEQETGLLGYSFAAFSLLLMTISYKSFRQGERWAWYTFWFLPVFFALIVITNLSIGGSLWQFYAAQLVISVVALVLPFRKFFPKTATTTGPNS